MRRSVLYVAQGRVTLKEPDRPPQVIESRFGQSLVERANQIQQRNAWKTQGTGAKFMSGRMLWGEDPDQSSAIPVIVNAISRGSTEDDILYSLMTTEIGGVFKINRSGTSEHRLLHTADFRIGDLSTHPSGDRIACAVRSKETAHLAVMRGDGAELTDVTQGDSLDGKPSWIPGCTSELVYQSSGVARNPSGVSVGTSSTRIERLNVDTGEVVTLLNDEKYDYLAPRMDAAGNLYCVRKPHMSTARFNPFRAALDLILFPFRLLFAFFQFMNFFTMRYTGKTLVTSGDMRQKQPDLRHMLMMDNLMQATRGKELFSQGGKKWNVSKRWMLIIKPASGEIRVLEKGVLAFDLCHDGSIIFTDGARVVLRQQDGGKALLAEDQFISQVLEASAE